MCTGHASPEGVPIWAGSHVSRALGLEAGAETNDILAPAGFTLMYLPHRYAQLPTAPVEPGLLFWCLDTGHATRPSTQSEL